MAKKKTNCKCPPCNRVCCGDWVDVNMDAFDEPDYLGLVINSHAKNNTVQIYIHALGDIRLVDRPLIRKIIGSVEKMSYKEAQRKRIDLT